MKTTPAGFSTRQPEAQTIYYNQRYLFLNGAEAFKGRIRAMGGVTAHVDVSGRERVVDVAQFHVYSDMNHDGILEVRSLWSRWSLEVKVVSGEIVGYITGQSAKTTLYVFESSDPQAITFTWGQIPEAPASAEKVLGQMMRKWRKFLPKQQS